MASVNGATTPFTLNGVTWVDIVAAPAAGTTRSVLFVRIYNADTASVEFELRIDVSGTPTQFDGIEAGRGTPSGDRWTPITRDTVIDLSSSQKLQARIRAAPAANQPTGIASYVDKTT